MKLYVNLDLMIITLLYYVDFDDYYKGTQLYFIRNVIVLK